MVYVITLEAPYSPIWDEGVLHSLIHSAIEAGNEAPVILRTTKEWAKTVYDSDLIELFVDYMPLDALLVMDMTQYEIKDGPIPDAWNEVFTDLIEAANDVKGLFKRSDSQTD